METSSTHTHRCLNYTHTHIHTHHGHTRHPDDDRRISAHFLAANMSCSMEVYIDLDVGIHTVSCCSACSVFLLWADSYRFTCARHWTAATDNSWSAFSLYWTKASPARSCVCPSMCVMHLAVCGAMIEERGHDGAVVLVPLLSTTKRDGRSTWLFLQWCGGPLSASSYWLSRSEKSNTMLADGLSSIAIPRYANRRRFDVPPCVSHLGGGMRMRVSWSIARDDINAHPARVAVGEMVMLPHSTRALIISDIYSYRLGNDTRSIKGTNTFSVLSPLSRERSSTNDTAARMSSSDGGMG
mmetsp:Transcript_48284/g.120861  ORF Transcript_48284/g.120861 Transcript_48284/m.120861 type:complete len:297 (+) Transcript_48284:228-1118(+)